MRLPALSLFVPFALGLLLTAAPLQARSPRKAARKTIVKTPAFDAVLAPAWVLMDPATGRVLESKNPHQRMFPASTTKTMTALLAIESGKLDEVFTISANPPKTGEQSILLQQGERFLLRDLVNAALIKSANDSCVAIAEAVAGDVPTFVKMMNAKAKELGAKNTHFCNPHGLHDANHYTTAYDLALIAQAAMRYPEFNAITRTKQGAIHGNWKIGPVRPLLNRNRLLFRWNQCDGVKTGYTRQAGRCLIASATKIDANSKESWRLLSVVFKSPDSWHDAQALLQYRGFAHFKPFTAARSGEEIGDAPVQNGAQVTAILQQDAVLTLREGEKSALTHEVQWNQLSAPLQAGQVVGHLDYFANGQKVAALPLVAKNDVPVSRLASIIPAGLNVASPFKGLNYLSFFPWPTTPQMMSSALLLLGVILLWGGLKGGRRLSHEKRKQPEQRATPNQAPNRQTPQRQAQNDSNGRVDSRSGPPNPRAAGSTQRAPSASNPQPQRTDQSADQQQAQQRPEPRSQAARQAEQSRHSAPGSIHQQRHQQRQKSRRKDSSKRPPCLGEQFITRFLTEETNAGGCPDSITDSITDNSAANREFADAKPTHSRW